jgi:hypothetical protein
MVCRYPRLWHAWFWWNNANNAKTKKIRVPVSTRQNGVSLNAVMCDYFKIMFIKAIIVIIAIILFYRNSVTRMCSHDVLFHNLNEEQPKYKKDVFETT